MSFIIRHEVSDQDVKDLLCCGMEGGIGYWAEIDDYIEPSAEGPYEYRHLDYPFTVDGAVIIRDTEEGDLHRLDRAALERGISLLSGYHLTNFLEENTDAMTGDVFVQLCLLGSIVYG